MRVAVLDQRGRLLPCSSGIRFKVARLETTGSPGRTRMQIPAQKRAHHTLPEPSRFGPLAPAVSASHHIEDDSSAIGVAHISRGDRLSPGAFAVFLDLERTARGAGHRKLA